MLSTTTKILSGLVLLFLITILVLINLYTSSKHEVEELEGKNLILTQSLKASEESKSKLELGIKIDQSIALESQKEIVAIDKVKAPLIRELYDIPKKAPSTNPQENKDEQVNIDGQLPDDVTRVLDKAYRKN